MVKDTLLGVGLVEHLDGGQLNFTISQNSENPTSFHRAQFPAKCGILCYAQHRYGYYARHSASIAEPSDASVSAMLGDLQVMSQVL